MKKLLLILLACFLFIFNVQAKENISITNMTCELKSNGKISQITPVIDGLDITLDDTTFYIKDDYLKCNITLKNNTSTNLKIDTTSISKLSNDNIKYSINDKSLQSNKETTYNLNVIYNSQTNIEENILNKIELVFNEDIKNPKTGQVSIILGLIYYHLNIFINII